MQFALPRVTVQLHAARGRFTGDHLMSSMRLRPLAAATFLFLLAGGAEAARRDELHRVDLASLNHQYKLATQANGAPGDASERFAELLGLEPESRLVAINHRVDRDGTHYYRFQQTFRGMPVWG